jgi:hypothetical protein
VPRSTLYGSIARLRKIFEGKGLQGYLRPPDVSQSDGVSNQ